MIDLIDAGRYTNFFIGEYMVFSYDGKNGEVAFYKPSSIKPLYKIKV